MDLHNFKSNSDSSQNILSTTGNKNGFEKNLFKNRSSSFINNKLPQPPALQNSLLLPSKSGSTGSFSNTDSVSYGSCSSKGSQSALFSETTLQTGTNVTTTSMRSQSSNALYGQQPLPGLKFNQSNLNSNSNYLKSSKSNFMGVQFTNPFQQRETMPFNNTSVPLIQRDRSLDSSSSAFFFKQDFSPLLKQTFESFQQQKQSLGLKKLSNVSIPKQTLNSPSRFCNEMVNQFPKFETYTIKNEVEGLSQENSFALKKKIKLRPKCDLCSKSFSRQSSLKTHITTVHKKIKNYECPYSNCNKKFSTNSNMRRHIRIHEKNKQLKVRKSQIVGSAIEELYAVSQLEAKSPKETSDEISREQS